MRHFCGCQRQNSLHLLMGPTFGIPKSGNAGISLILFSYLDHSASRDRRITTQELAYGTRMDELFANTLSLPCVKLAMIHAAQEGKNRKLMTSDVKSAFLYGAIRRKIYIELPSADPESGGSKVGVLHKAPYGTCDAPQIWQHEVRKTLKELGFRHNVTQPSVYVHDQRGIYLVVHVDDFLMIKMVLIGCT